MSLPDALRPCAEWIRTRVGPAHQFGIHATIGDALICPDELVPKIASRLETIAREMAPFTRLLTTFDSPDGALQHLDQRVVREIKDLYTGSPHFVRCAESCDGLRRT